MALLLECHCSLVTQAPACVPQEIMPWPDKHPFRVLTPEMTEGSTFTSGEATVACGQGMGHTGLVVQGLCSVSSPDSYVSHPETS